MVLSVGLQSQAIICTTILPLRLYRSCLPRERYSPSPRATVPSPLVVSSVLLIFTRQCPFDAVKRKITISAVMSCFVSFMLCFRLFHYGCHIPISRLHRLKFFSRASVMCCVQILMPNSKLRNCKR